MFRLYYECGIDAKYVTPKHQKKKWSVKNNNCLHLRGSRVGYSFMMPIICTQLFLVTISLVILTNNNQSMILSVADGYRPFHIIFNQAFNCQLYMRELIFISVKTKSGNFQEHACL